MKKQTKFYLLTLLASVLYGLGMLVPNIFIGFSIISFLLVFYLVNDNLGLSYKNHFIASAIFAYVGLTISYFNIFDSMEYFSSKEHLRLFQMIGLIGFAWVLHPFYFFFFPLAKYLLDKKLPLVVVSLVLTAAHTLGHFQLYSNPISSVVYFIEYFHLMFFIKRMGYLFFFILFFLMIVKRNFKFDNVFLIFIFVFLHFVIRPPERPPLHAKFNLFHPNKLTGEPLDLKFFNQHYYKESDVINLLPEATVGSGTEVFYNYPNLVGGALQYNGESDKAYRSNYNSVMFSKDPVLGVQSYFKENLLIFGETTYFLDEFANKNFGLKFLKAGVNEDRVFKFKNLKIEPLLCSEVFHPLYYLKDLPSDIIIVFASTIWAKEARYILTFHHESRWIARERNQRVIFLNNGGWSSYVNPNGKVLVLLPWGYSGGYLLDTKQAEN